MVLLPLPDGPVMIHMCWMDSGMASEVCNIEGGELFRVGEVLVMEGSLIAALPFMVGWGRSPADSMVDR